MQNLADLIKNKPQFKTLQKDFNSGKLSHAFLVVGDDAVIKSAFCAEVAKFLCGEHNIADKHIYNNFLVADCNDLTSKINLKPMMCDNKVFVVDAGELSVITQNKILKTIEEPTANTYFFLTGKSEDMFLPTIKSRCAKIVLQKLDKEDFENLGFGSLFEKSGGNLTLAQKFQNAAFAKKFELVLECLRVLKKSSEIINFARKFAKNKDELNEVLDIFEVVLANLLQAKTKNKKFFDNTINEEFSAKMAALIIEAILAAKKQAKANCSAAAIVDELLLKILEIKFICKKNSL